MTHPGGRPRTISFSIQEMEELGKEMLEWVIQNNPLHIKQWYCIEKMFTYKEWKTFIQRSEFIPYYEKALGIIGLQYLDRESRIRDSIAQRWQRHYFGDLREEENETAAYNASLKQLETSQRDEEAHKKLDNLSESFNSFRYGSCKESNNDLRSNNTDNKS